ncbi:acyl-CoA thioesterase [Limnobacter parvus]|uniref:Acyl-CoA thioesterase n=1 Tax=Limnobacter parvus TaxID=2939690 RepID=A0ABT1XKT5_9BURK|nr:acyl-CoA thioesterase [Limnobacter parvus]MCR2747900.1 acyl-CoA thioesterase [Limnobacter parvus]
MAEPFQFLFRVRYGECDAQGVVFNARYGDYVDLALTEYMRAAIGGYNELLHMGFETQVVRLLTEWKSPARFDEVLKTSVYPSHFGNTSFTLNFEFVNASTNVLVATSQATYVLVDVKEFTKQIIPAQLKSALQKGAVGKQINQAG